MFVAVHQDTGMWFRLSLARVMREVAKGRLVIDGDRIYGGGWEVEVVS